MLRSFWNFIVELWNELEACLEGSPSSEHVQDQSTRDPESESTP
jgi:hypothetical protein